MQTNYPSVKTGNSFCRFLLGMFCVFFSFSSFSQMMVTPTNMATTLAQAIAGNGVTVTNPALNCGASAAGQFTFSGTDLGLTGGILLTTGLASDAANPGSYLCNVTNGNNYSDSNLTALVPTANLDVCILEFDFIPSCDTLNMKYVFGSEEYHKSGVYSQYNDAFAIFLTGPNPAGGSYSEQNIATLPNGTAVSINNVNATTNQAYFHPNYTNPNNDVAYDGYTIPITSITAVAPCSTYHMKIAIADAGNAEYDSGVFISNNTLSCQSPPVITAGSSPTSGCSSTGSATVTVSNYTGTPTYHWKPGGQTTAVISSLAAGTYTCSVDFHERCGIITQTITTTVINTGSSLVLTSSQQNLTCNGASNATATVTAIGGTSPYAYSWSTVPVQTTNVATNLPAGTYTASVTDNGGCQSTIEVIITAPPAMQVTFTNTPTTCTGSIGTSSVTVLSNGTAPYHYVWSSGPSDTLSEDLNLAQGVYSVTITDAKHCSVTAVTSITVQAIGWSATAITNSTVACYGESNGAVSVTINNPGSNTFTYSWNTIPMQSSQTASNVPVGTYTCTVHDNNGCVLTASTSVSQPALLSASLTTVPTMCSGSVGSSTTQVSGGTKPYTYTWTTTPTQTTGNASGLAQGQYTVIIQDTHGCDTSLVATIGTVYPILQIKESVINSVCGGPSGALNVYAVIPNAPPYSYSWSTTPSYTTSGISNLFPGTYSVTITDNNGCVGISSATVGINTGFPIPVSTTPDYCNKGTGTAIAFPKANPPYQYQWNTVPQQIKDTATHLAAGTYTVLVTDHYGCKDSVSVIIGVSPSLSVQTTSLPDRCNKAVGSATANPSNGYYPYHYLWSNTLSTTTQTAINLSAGNYTVQVSDSLHCMATASITVINQNDLFSSVFETQPTGTLYSLDPVTISITTNAGWTLDTAYLSDGTAINGLSTHHVFQQSGNYTATYYFTSNHSCVDSVIYDLLITDYMTLYIPNSFTPNGDGRNDVFKAEGTFINSFEMYIYDRWGNQVATLTDIDAEWNGFYKGQEALIDTYVYKGTAIDISGNLVSFQGQISLIR
jgi:gliding motility-associated-like protein